MKEEDFAAVLHLCKEVINFLLLGPPRPNITFEELHRGVASVCLEGEGRRLDEEVIQYFRELAMSRTNLLDSLASLSYVQELKAALQTYTQAIQQLADLLLFLDQTVVQAKMSTTLVQQLNIAISSMTANRQMVRLSTIMSTEDITEDLSGLSGQLHALRPDFTSSHLSLLNRAARVLDQDPADLHMPATLRREGRELQELNNSCYWCRRVGAIQNCDQ